MTGRPLRVAALAKQVSVLGTVEINPYCRRAIAFGVRLARDTGGTCTVFTMGPPSAREVLVEAVAFGADTGVHVCDPALAGADLLVTARALAGALDKFGPFDLILVGQSSADAETGQVGPYLAGLLDLPFTGAASELSVGAGRLHASCQQDDLVVEVSAALPAVVAVAERLCPPAKVPAPERADPGTAISVLDLGVLPAAVPGSASPTSHRPRPVPALRRGAVLLSGTASEQARAAVEALAALGALDEPAAAGVPEVPAARPGDLIEVLSDPQHPELTPDLLAAAAEIGGTVRVLCGPGQDATDLGRSGADEIWRWPRRYPGPAAVAAARLRYPPAALVLAPATTWGRTAAGRYAVATGAGLIADALGFTRIGATTVAQVAAGEVRCDTSPTVVTVRPGVLPSRLPRPGTAVPQRTWRTDRHPADVTVHGRRRVDDWAALARASVVVAVGQGVDDVRAPAIGALLEVLGAELAGTRKLTDAGVLPRSRQIGVTGRGVRPRLYVAIGLSGRPHHLAGIAGAGAVLAINVDPAAPVFAGADVGIVAPWQEAVPALAAALRAR
ncbi:MAG: electron transfer flavoprotein alpha subunit [Micromonosporaceae bacterium]